MNNTNFEAIKAEILSRAKAAAACTEQYNRAYRSCNLPELCTVIKNNFLWCCYKKVIDGEILERYKDDFAANDICINTDANKGYLLAWGNASVKAWGNATVVAWGNASVEACHNAPVKAWGNATVVAWGNATVEAWGNATVKAWGNATVEAWGNATVEAWGNATVEAWGNATVEAWGNAYCTSLRTIECKLSDNALYRVRYTNTVYFASDDINFMKQ